MTSDPNYSSNLQAALDAVQRGDRPKAARLARLAVQETPESETAWLMLAGLVDPAEGIDYVIKALEINPGSQRAWQAMEWIQNRLAARPPQAEPAAAPVEAVEPPASLAEESGAAPAPQEVQSSTQPVQVAPALEPAAPSAADVEPTPPAETASTGVGQPPQAAAEMQPVKSAPPTAAPRNRRPAPILVWGSLMLCLLVLLALAAGWYFFGDQLNGLWEGFFPAAGCRASLALHGDSYAIQTTRPDQDGVLAVPASAPGKIFWVEGTVTNAVYLLDPGRDNLVLAASVKAGDLLTVTQTTCNATVYTLSAMTPGVLNDPALLDQSRSMITIFAPTNTSGLGFILRGELQGETITHFSAPDPASLQVEVSLLGVTPSADKTTITVEVSIYNAGQKEASLAAGEIALAPESGPALALSQSEPPLPLAVGPGKTQSVKLTFPRPAAVSAMI